MENQQSDSAVHPDKALFAQDLINYIINEFYGIYYRLDEAERFREITYNAFDDTVKLGVNIIAAIQNVSFVDMDEITWDSVNYYSLTDHICKNFLNRGLEPLNFLQFCVCVTVLAKEFLSHGLPNAPHLAAVVIYHSLLDYDMLLGGWDSLNFAAKEFKKAVHLLEVIITATPDASSADISDDELPQRIDTSFYSDVSSDEEMENADTDENVPSDESRDEFKLREDDSEIAFAFNTERWGGNYQLPNVSTENQHTQPIHGYLSSDVREKFETQQDDVKDILNANKQSEDENPMQCCAITNGRPLQHACGYQTVVEDDGNSTNSER